MVLHLGDFFRFCYSKNNSQQNEISEISASCTCSLRNQHTQHWQHCQRVIMLCKPASKCIVQFFREILNESQEKRVVAFHGTVIQTSATVKNFHHTILLEQQEDNNFLVPDSTDAKIQHFFDIACTFL